MDNNKNNSKFDFKTKDIGIKTAVKIKNFAKIRVKKPEFFDFLKSITAIFAKFISRIKLLLGNFSIYAKNQMREPKKRKIFIIKFIGVIATTIAIILSTILIVVKITTKEPLRLEKLSDADIISRLETALSENGKRSESSDIVDAITVKIQKYQDTGDYLGALTLTKKAEKILEKHNLEDVILGLFNAFDLKKFDKKQQIEILEYFSNTTKKLGNKIITDEINQLLEDIKNSRKIAN